jgi:predicted nucleotidyltransferase
MKAALDTLTPALVAAILRVVPDAQALYAFGSQARGDANAESDLDLAVLAPQPIPPLVRFALQGELATIAGCDVDLVDLRSANTVMRAQVYRSDLLLHEGDRHARQWFEMLALSDYARLNEERRAILADVHARGKVFG